MAHNVVADEKGNIAERARLDPLAAGAD